MTQIGLGPAQLTSVFPFHIGFASDLRIFQLGSAWRRVCGALQPGASMADCFRLVRPDLPLVPETLPTILGSLVVFQCLSNGLPLRGQVLQSDCSDDLLFIGSPLVHELADLKRFGLSLGDWAAHEAAVDFLFLLRSKELALDEARALSESLSRRQADLRAAVREREEAQAAISAREASLRAILDTAAEGIVTIDDHGIIQSFNAAAARLFGWAAEEIVGSNVSVLVPPPERDEHDAYIARYRETGVKTIIGRGREVEGVRRDGTRFPLHLSVSEVQGPQGRTFTGILHDLSDLKRAQRALEATEARTRLIVDTALDAVITIDQEGCVTLWNAQAQAMFGWTREEALGRVLADLVIPHGLRAAHAAGMRRYLSTGEAHVLNRRIEITGLHRDGHEFPVELAITPLRDGDALSFSAFVRDISARKRGEQLLRVQYEVTRILALDAELAQAASQLIHAACEYLRWGVGALWLLDPRGGGLRCVDLWHEPTLDLGAFVTETREMIFPPGVGLPGRVLASGEPLWLPAVAEDANFPRAASAAAAGLGSGIALPITVDGRVEGVIEFFTRQQTRPDADVVTTLSTLARQIGQFIERKHATEALRQSETRLRSVIDYMLEGLVVVGDDLRILEANPAFARMFGFPLEELIGLPIVRLMPLRPEYQEPASLAGLFRQSVGRVTEREGRRRTGEIFPLQLQLYEVGTPEGRVLAGHVRDLSQEREADRLKKQFVASVSHELRTPLTAIRGSLGLLSQGAVGPLPPDAAEVVGMAERNAVRLVGIINDLLDFERIQSGILSVTPALFPLDLAIERACESVEALAQQSGISVTTAPSGVEVWADEARIVQVLVNLVANAIKFSPAGTQVDVTVTRGTEHAEVRVRDHGRGVPADLQEMIFQPFRQAEESDARTHGGSGIGLAICRAIVAQHGGDIGVESHAGAGSTFWFTIPLSGNHPVSAS